jgi:hypothetical protein
LVSATGNLVCADQERSVHTYSDVLFGKLTQRVSLLTSLDKCIIALQALQHCFVYHKLILR